MVRKEGENIPLATQPSSPVVSAMTGVAREASGLFSAVLRFRMYCNCSDALLSQVCNHKDNYIFYSKLN